MQTMRQRLRSDEHAIRYLLFAVGIGAWLLLTGGFDSYPVWPSLVVNSGLCVLALYLVGRAYLRLRRPVEGRSNVVSSPEYPR